MLRVFFYFLEKHKIYVKYIIAGLCATVVDFGLLFLLHGVWKVNVVVAASIAFASAVVISFTLQKFWTFRDASRKHIYLQFIFYFSMGVVNTSLNAYAMHVLVNALGVYYMLAQAMTGIVLALSSFTISRYFIFRLTEDNETKIKTENKSLRLLLATGIYPPDIGGPATYTRELMRLLPSRRVAVRILTYSDEGSDRSNERVIKVNRRQGLFFRYWEYFWQVLRDTANEDIVYAHDLVSVGLPCAIAKTFRPRFKLVFRLGGDFLWEKAYNNGWTDKSLARYYAQPKNIWENIYLWIYEFVLSSADHIVFSTEWQKNIYQKQFKLSDEKISVIKNAFPNIILPLVKKETNKKQKEIIFAGRLVAVKNIQRLIDAVGQIDSVYLSVIGDGPDKFYLENYVQEANLSERIKFFPSLKKEDLFSRLLSCFLVAVPMISEISPNVVYECIKLGVPTVVSKESGIYKDYKNDLLFFDPFSVDDIRKKIEYLLVEKNYADYVKKIKNIDSERSWLDLVDEHMDLFKRLMEDREEQ